MECFYEQFQTKNYGKLRTILNNLPTLVLIIASIYAIAFQWIMVVIFAIIYFCIVIINNSLFLEYEYELTNNELVIYKIMNQKSRKTIANINVNEILEIKDIEQINKSSTKIIKAYLSGVELKDKVLLIRGTNGHVGYQVAMDEKLTQLIRRMNQKAFINGSR